VAAAIRTGYWCPATTPSEYDIPHRCRNAFAPGGKVGLGVRRFLQHGQKRSAAGVAFGGAWRGCFFFKGVKRLGQKLVSIVKLAALNLLAHALFKLGLMDFEVHGVYPPFIVSSLARLDRAAGGKQECPEPEARGAVTTQRRSCPWDLSSAS